MLKILCLVVAFVLHTSGVALADDTQQAGAGEAFPAPARLTAAPTSTGSPPGARYPACASEPDAQSIQAARGAFEAGKAAFEEGDYDRAIMYWEDAYRRDCTAHAMLKNLAR